MLSEITIEKFWKEKLASGEVFYDESKVRLCLVASAASSALAVKQFTVLINLIPRGLPSTDQKIRGA